ncbi:MAG: exonuclease domain-containing protein [Chloroflexia bacterium]
MADPLLSLPLYRAPYAVVDVETTGLHAALGDAICEIAILRAQEGRVHRWFHTLVDPGRPVSPEAYAVNRITEEMLRGAPTFEQVADRVLAELEGAVLVAHNAPFDLLFLVAAFQEASRAVPSNPVLDTLAIARNCYGFSRNSLHAIASDLQIAQPGRHRALADTWTTWRLLEFFCRDLPVRRGIGTVGELVRLQGGPIRWPEGPDPDELPEVLVEALEGRRLLFLRYCSSAGTVTERAVEPLRVGVYQGTFYLIARCLWRGEQRTFRLDRVLEMRLHDGIGEL